MVTPLVNESERRGKTKRSGLHVERTPRSRLNVGVSPLTHERGDEEVLGTRAAQVVERGEDVALAEMDERVAAQDEVGGGKPLAAHLTTQEAAPGRGTPLTIGPDQCGNDVDANVGVHRISQGSGPVEVAARDVEKSPDAK